MTGVILAIVFLLTAGISPITIGDNYEEEKINYYFVKFNQQTNKGIFNNLKESELDFEYYYQDNTYLVKIKENMVDEILSLPYVDSIEPYLPSNKIHPDLQDKSGRIKLKVVLHKDSDIIKTREKLNNLGIQIDKINEICQKHIICYTDATNINDIASFKNVYWIEELSEKTTSMNIITSDTYIGHDSPQVGGYIGAGVLAEVQDNGIDTSHGDFGSIIYTDGTIQAEAHGTCTSGIIFGDGSGDINAQGIAYQATGAFSDWNVGFAQSISNLWNGNFNEGNAGMNGVVQSNSWQYHPLDGEYDANTEEIDQAAVNFPHVLSCWCAANSQTGTDEGDISGESVAKNVISVGGVFHMNTASMADDEWQLHGMGNTPSRGPATDNRQKPDLCGPVDWIYTVDRPGTAGYTNGDYYDGFGGTSGATPVVAGSAVLTYDMYQDNYFGNNPTGEWPFSCTIKALLIADAHQYALTAATRTAQGWGTPDMEYMYNLGETYHVIAEYPQALNTGDMWNRIFYVDGTYPLKATLTWIDPAAPAATGTGRALINNLDLRLESPSGTVYWGNNGLDNNLWSTSGTGTNHWSQTNDHRDDLNNVENVFIQSPEQGFWTVEVMGRTGGIPQGPQDFSLVISGALNNEITKGLSWLRHQQNPDGSWNDDVGVTAMCDLTFMNYGCTEDDPVVEDAIDWILGSGHVHGDGSIYSTYGYRTYQNSLAILALVAADRTNEPDKYTTYIANAANWLNNSQWDEGEGYNSGHDWYGGFGYGSGNRPDLSNTQWALMALAAAGFGDNDPMWAKALIFTEKCQNPDGGFQYTPGGSLSSAGSYGSMTAAGIWSYKLSGLSNTDSRITDAQNWFTSYYTWDENPNMKPDGRRFLYYYYCTIAKALIMIGQTHVVVSGTPHDWYQEMSEKIISLQHDDGHWVNTYTGHGSEGNPNIATGFSLLALETRTLPPGAELWMSIILASYADLHVYDQQGRHTGKVYDQNGDWTGETEEEIPGSSYEIINEKQIIDLSQLEAGSYRIELVGTSIGEYNLTVIGKQDGLEVYNESWEGEITDEEVHATDVIVTAMEGALTIFSSPPILAPVMDVEPNIIEIFTEYNSTVEKTFEISSRFNTTHAIIIHATDMVDEYGNIIGGENFIFNPNGFEVQENETVTVNMTVTIPDMTGGWIYTGKIIVESSDAGSKWINITIYLGHITATIDIDPDTLNLKNKGKWITCYIELPDGYNVTNITVSTILLNDVVPAEDHPTNISDYDNDSIPDLMVKFDRQAVQDILEAGDNVEIIVAGELIDGTYFSGIDIIRVI